MSKKKHVLTNDQAEARAVDPYFVAISNGYAGAQTFVGSTITNTLIQVACALYATGRMDAYQAVLEAGDLMKLAMERAETLNNELQVIANGQTERFYEKFGLAAIDGAEMSFAGPGADEMLEMTKGMVPQ